MLLIINDTFGQSMLRGINALMPKANLPFKIVESISYDPKAKDLSVEVAKAKAANAELQMVVTRLNDAIILVREMVKQSYEPMASSAPAAPACMSAIHEGARQIRRLRHHQHPWLDPKQELDQGSRRPSQGLSRPGLRRSISASPSRRS